MNVKSFAPITFEPAALNQPSPRQALGGGDTSQGQAAYASPARSSLHLVREQLSPWSQSSAKRLFDCTCVLLALPLLIPILLVIAFAVRFTSRGPILFLQKRMGRHGCTFTILKFRTLAHCQDATHNAVTTTDNQRFTPIGPFLRRWKLDEVPQLLNVLWGDMSLVGARPKLPEHQIADLEYRPGITGAATIAFAREEMLLARVPKDHLDTYYHTVILPAKHMLDTKYMSRATFFSDLYLIVNSLLRRWNSSAIDRLLSATALGTEAAQRESKGSFQAIAGTRIPTIRSGESVVAAEQYTEV